MRVLGMGRSPCGSLRNWSRLCLLALAALAVLVPATPASAWDCYSDIGCTECRGRPSGNVFLIWCGMGFFNGGCACFTWQTDTSVECQNYGSCLYTGWNGGGPPPV